jgi:hypothetical protein
MPLPPMATNARLRIEAVAGTLRRTLRDRHWLHQPAQNQNGAKSAEEEFQIDFEIEPIEFLEACWELHSFYN